MRRTLLLLILFTILSGCNLGREDDSPTNTPDAATLDPGSRPEVTILSPEDGDEFLVDEPIIISVAVSGSNNITRVQLNANDETRVVAPESPDEDQYLLDYTPREDGRLDLTVIASSGVLQSEPETITVFVRQNQRQITATSSGGTNINPNDPTCRVLVNVGLNFRRGPSVDFEVIRVLAPGEVIPIVGRLGDNSWWQLSSGTSIGWVDARFVTTYGNCTGIAAVAPPATATPPSSATPIPTATSVVPTNTPIPQATSTPVPQADPNLLITNIAGPDEVTIEDGDTDVTVEYSVNLTNSGGAVSQQFSNTVRVSSGGNTEEFDLGVVGGLGAGQTINLSVDVTFDAPGTYILRFTADSDNDIQESNEVDNRVVLDVNVEAE